MRALRRITSIAASVAAASAIMFALPQAAQAASSACPSGDNPAVWNPDLITTPRPAVYVWNRKIELRYHTSTRCAWGRISNGLSGDLIWVDWSTSGGANWTQLGVKPIPSGGTQVYTTAYNDRDVVMRACGKAGDRVEIACTGWY